MPIRHVLVVDDSKSARLMLRKILQNLGLTVDTADSAEEALAYLRDRKPDVIFMDHTMPGMDGLTALRRIRSEPATADIPAAMYTSKDEPTYRNEAHAAGAVDILSKPATTEALNALLERMNHLLDAAVHLPTTSVPVSEGVSAEWVEKLILEKSEQVFYNAVESQVLPLINDVVVKLRLDLEQSQEEISHRIVAQAIEKQLANWQPPPSPAVDARETVEAVLQTQLPSLVEERLKTFQREERVETDEQLIQEIATRVCQSQLHTFTDQLASQLSARFSEAMRKASVTAQEAAVETARETAQDAAMQAVTETRASTLAEESSTATAVRVARNLLAEARRELQRLIYLAAGGAAVVGIGAALLVYGLR